jgi:hypothetical protein
MARAISGVVTRISNKEAKHSPFFVGFSFTSGVATNGKHRS